MAKDLGYQFAVGFCNRVIDVVFVILVLALIATAVTNWMNWNVDSTDMSGWKRSGMTLYTDYGTGIQYLSNGTGIVERSSNE